MLEGSGMTGIHKTDNRRPVPRAFAEVANQAAGVPPGSDEQNPAAGCHETGVDAR